MTEILLTGWSWYPSVLIGFGLWTAAYVWLTSRGVRNGPGQPPAAWHQAAFHIGTLIGLLALVSPLDELGDEYLFSAHMLQHLLLMFVTAPLWLIGSPGWLIDSIIPRPLRGLAKLMTRPAAAFLAFTAVMSVWHIPALYDLAQNSEALHIFEHLTFIGSALIGWWPVAGPDGRIAPRPAAPARILYLFLLAIPMTAMAAMLTFASAPSYAFYVQAPRLFGLSALEDQHLGGLLMWIPTHMIILLALGITFFKWLSRNEGAAAEALLPNSF